MIEDPPIVIDEQPDESGMASTAAHSYDVGVYMREGRVCDGIVRALGRALRTDPLDLPPLYAAVDCDGVEQLFRPYRDGRPRDDVTLAFVYEGYAVTITADGRLTIRDAAGDTQD